jgi:signal transduction histidine kinase
MKKHLLIPQRFIVPLTWTGILSGLYISSLHSYLFFHSLAEIFSIIVACGIFMLSWNSRRFMENHYFLFIGIAYIFIGFMEMIHTLAYKGMGVFPGYDANLPTQLWIATRYIGSLTLLIAPFFIVRKIRVNLVWYSYALAVILILLSLFYWNIFPVCYVENTGLTPFKIISEFIISGILVSAILLLRRKREHFNKSIYQLLVFSMISSIASELCFTLYISVYGLPNLMGHFLKIISFYLVYKAVIEIGLTRPYDLLFRELALAKEKAEKASRFKSDYLASMSHELRTPLNSVIGYSEMLEVLAERNRHPEYIPDLTLIRESGEHLLSLINDILDLSKIEAGKIELFPETIPILELVQDLLFMIKPLADKNKNKLELICPPDMGTFRADVTRVRQILLNILSNACKFSQQGLITLEVTKQEIDSEPWVSFRIQDTGIGMDSEQISKIFTEYSQVDRDARRKQEGTGLGLYISKQFCEMMGGYINVKSDPERGSIFTVKLPAFHQMTRENEPDNINK